VEYAKALRKFYLAASKKDKTGILNEFGRVTGYHRKSAVRLLLHPPAGRGCRRGRPPKYDRELVRPLVKLWEASDCAGSKRLQPFLPFLLASLEDHKELQRMQVARREGQVTSGYERLGHHVCSSRHETCNQYESIRSKSVDSPSPDHRAILSKY